MVLKNFSSRGVRLNLTKKVCWNNLDEDRKNEKSPFKRRFRRRCRSEIVRFLKYRKIPKVSPGAHIFQRPFLRGLFWEGLIIAGAYL